MIQKSERALATLAVALVFGVSAQAGSPQIGNISPFGVQRGVATEVTVNGGNLLGNPHVIAPFPIRTEPVDPKRSSAGAWTFRMTVASDVAIGVYPIRVQTDDGLSNLFLFSVGQLPQVSEKEENSTFESAQLIPTPPLVVEGQAAGNDVDFFKFSGKKGQKIVIDAQCARIGSGVDPTIRLTTAASTRRFIASADDSPGLLTDSRLVTELPEDTDYVVEVSDSRYQGGGRPVYRLLIGSVPVADEIYPLGGRAGETVGFELRGGTMGGMRIAAATLAPPPGTFLHWPRMNCQFLGSETAANFTRDVESVFPLIVENLPELREPVDPLASPARAVAPVVFNGRIDPPGDQDRFTLAVTPGQRLHVSVDASAHGSALDGTLRVLGSNGSQIAEADDTAIPNTAKQGMPGSGLVSPDPSLNFTVPGNTNEIALELRDLEGRGGVGFPYRIIVEPIVPNFELGFNEPQISIPRGGNVAVGLTVVRKEYNGPITVTVVDPPSGITVRPAAIGEGQKVGALTISATASASFSALPLKIVGRGQGPNGAIEIEAVNQVVFAKQDTLPTSVLIQRGLAAAPALPTPVTLDSPAEPIEVAHGYGASIPIKATRTKGADAALSIAPLPLPPGVTVPAASIAEKAASTAVPVQTTLDAPLGMMTLALQVKGKLAGIEQTIAVPAIALKLVRPADIKLAVSAVEVKPGATVQVSGKLQRHGSFKEPVTIKANGLPAGLRADAVTLAAPATDFVLKIIADARAAPATSKATLAAAYQVSKKDYPSTSVPLSVKVLPAK
jgi:hypothetical protein